VTGVQTCALPISARTTHEARMGGIFSIVFNTLIIVGPAAFIGLMALIVFPPVAKHGLLSAAATLGTEGGYNVISTYINLYMNPWLKALLVFLLSAHTMSTVANYCNISAMNLSYDLLQPLVFRKRKWSDEKIVKWSRLITVVMVGVNILIAQLYNLPAVGSSLNLAYQLSSGLLTAGIAVMIYVLWWKRANLTGVLLGGACGTIGTVSFFILEYVVWKNSYTMPVWDWIFGKGAMASSYYGYCVIGLVCGLIGLVIGTYLSPPPTKAQLDSIADQPVDDNEEFFAGLNA
jgi:SSS family solute:Na+ symporter